MIRWLFIILVTIATGQMWGQGPYAPPAGQPGSTAIHKDSGIFVGWATNCIVSRGYLDIANPSLGRVTAGSPADATGKSGVNGTVSLGDSGVATVTFNGPIFNGPGPDFAVFENSFDGKFLELAFVEVSSDGNNFTRFPAVSLTQDTAQITNAGQIDATNIHNLAGKYKAQYGTPFDLEELKGTPGLDVNNITHVRMVDVVGSIDTNYASYDSQDHKINDPYTTAWNTCGFDMDAVGVIYSSVTGITDNSSSFQVDISLQNGQLFLKNQQSESVQISLYTTDGKIIYETTIAEKVEQVSAIAGIGNSLIIARYFGVNSGKTRVAKLIDLR